MTPVGVSGVTKITSGRFHVLALLEDRTVKAWEYSPSGDRIQVPEGLKDVVDIAAGSDFSLALKDDGTVVGWGGSFWPTPPVDLTGVIAITAGEYHALALKSDGTVVGWGSNAHGAVTVPDNLGPVKQIVAGKDHSAALLESGQLVIWGKRSPYTEGLPNGIGEIFSGTTADATFFRISDPENMTPFEVEAGRAGLFNIAGVPSAAPFGDRVANLLKFAFGMDLSRSDQARMQTGGTLGLPLIGLDHTAGAPSWRFEYVRRTHGGIRYTPRIRNSPTSPTWAPPQGSEQVETINNAWERVTTFSPVDLGAEPTGFADIGVAEEN